eukprot:scaffold687946_cov189-Attheya_sp.AAC.1
MLGYDVDVRRVAANDRRSRSVQPSRTNKWWAERSTQSVCAADPSNQYYTVPINECSWDVHLARGWIASYYTHERQRREWRLPW